MFSLLARLLQRGCFERLVYLSAPLYDSLWAEDVVGLLRRIVLGGQDYNVASGINTTNAEFLNGTAAICWSARDVRSSRCGHEFDCRPQQLIDSLLAMLEKL